MKLYISYFEVCVMGRGSTPFQKSYYFGGFRCFSLDIEAVSPMAFESPLSRSLFRSGNFFFAPLLSRSFSVRLLALRSRTDALSKPSTIGRSFLQTSRSFFLNHALFPNVPVSSL